MSRRQEGLIAVIAFLVTVLFYASLNGPKFTRTGAGSAGGTSFHGGKKTLSLNRDAVCITPQCHATSPHRKPGSTSVFLNMHQTTVSCLGCHGRDPERRWGPGGTEGDGAFRLTYTPVPGVGRGGRRHDANGVPAPCRRCHSMEGRRAIASSGVKGLPEGFENPIALRMIEGGGRKWLPDDMQ